jgi:hypothetical protein
LGAILVARPPTLSIKPRQVTGAIIFIKIELHSLFVGLDRLVEILSSFRRRRRRDVYLALISTAEQAKALRRRSDRIDQHLEFCDGLCVVADLSSGKRAVFQHFRVTRKTVRELAHKIEHNVPIRNRIGAIA